MTSRTRLLGSLLLIVAPVGCGDDSSSSTGSVSETTGGYGGSGQSGAAGASGSEQAGASGSGQAGAPASWCEPATPQVYNGKPTGLTVCADGRVVRRQDAACADQGPGSCRTDADCPATMVCNCELDHNQCRPASCATSDDCTAGQECTFYRTQSTGFCHSDPGTYRCTTPQDTCGIRSDCEGSQDCWSDGGAWTCHDNPTCGVGRPLVVEHLARVARLQAMSGWG